MKINSVPQENFFQAISSSQIRYEVGPFIVQLQSDLRSLSELFYRLYGNYAIADNEPIADFQLSLRRPHGIRRWYRPQVQFMSDGQRPFAPFPADTAFPLLEWGLNWCIAMRAHQYLMLHAAAVEKNGKAVILPAIPGTGKSTLCAALIHRGWRLMSDEFGLVDPRTTRLVPLPRCIPLKNQSIEIIRDYCPNAVIGPTFPKTRKGDVAHLQPPVESIERGRESARASYVVFPKYDATAKNELRPLPKARAFIKLSSNSFNYEVLGSVGFETVAAIIESSDCYLLHYNHLDSAIALLNGIVGGADTDIANEHPRRSEEHQHT